MFVFYYYVQEVNQQIVIAIHTAKLAGRLQSYYEKFITLLHHSDKCKIEYHTDFLFFQILMKTVFSLFSLEKYVLKKFLVVQSKTYCNLYVKQKVLIT